MLGRILLYLLVATLGTACSSLPDVKTNTPGPGSIVTTPPTQEAVANPVPKPLPVPVIVMEPETEVRVVDDAGPTLVFPSEPTTPVKVVQPAVKPATKPPVKVVPVIAKPVITAPAATVKDPLTPTAVPTPSPMPYGRKPVTDWRAKTIPEAMKKFFTIIQDVVHSMWVDFKFPSMILAQIEQETCISPTHSKCGSTKAELKTSREYGFGIGQTTIAYKADGTERFNVWKELRAKDPVLNKSWTWENRFDAELQVRALLVKNRMGYSAVKFDTADEFQKLAFSFVTYNSGSPLVDRKLCEAQPDCDPRYWFNTATKKGVEAYSAKSRVVQKGYGQSFYDISREYPIMLLYVRRQKYIPYVEQILEGPK